MPMRGVPALLTIAIGLVTLACVSPSDPLGRNDALEMAQKRYTESVRWRKFEEASRYVDPALRDEFLALEDRFEQVRFTDYDVGDVESADHDTAEVEVTYRAYALPYYVEKEVQEQQEWYRDGGAMGNTWRVRPQLSLLLETLYPDRP